MKDYSRIIGTFEERIKMLTITQAVYRLLPELHPDLDFDYSAFSHITMGFLREKPHSKKLLGLCSFNNSRRGNYDKYSERHGVNRILICRTTLNSSLQETIRTIHHEFVHAMLRDFNEPHGPRFQLHNQRIEPYIDSIVRMINVSDS